MRRDACLPQAGFPPADFALSLGSAQWLPPLGLDKGRYPCGPGKGLVAACPDRGRGKQRRTDTKSMVKTSPIHSPAFFFCVKSGSFSAPNQREVHMPQPAQFWLAVGSPENWHTAFDYGGIWGLRRSQRRYWETITENDDIVFFYATSPVAGVVGYGLVRTKLRQDSPLWPDERARNEIIWPLRFEFDVMACLAPRFWKEQKIVLPELKARARAGFQSLEKHVAEELMQALPTSVPGDLVLAQPIGLRSGDEVVLSVDRAQPSDVHGRTQWLLAEIGRLQRFVSDREYPLANRRLDVVWRRVQRSVPSYVFEVHVGGNLTEGMGKLKQAFELWNSNIFLVGKEEHRRSVNELVGGTFHEIQERLRFLELPQIQDLYQRKRAYRQLEAELGLMR